MTSIEARIDPELRAASRQALDAFPGGLNNIRDLSQRRAIAYAISATEQQDAADLQTVTWRNRWVEGFGDSDTHRVQVRIYTPKGAARDGAILFLHSGGMILGDLEWEHAHAARLSATSGLPLVSVDYRLAPEAPYPAALEDCLAVQRWLTAGADGLISQPDRYIVHGASAGGGLGIATVLRARDERGRLPALVMAIYPMIDDRPTPSSQEISGIGVWDREHNREGWQHYLGGRDADQYAAPSRATDLTGFPPTFIDVGELDVFRDENIAFAHRLMQHGVPTELHVYPGAFHGSDGMAPAAAVSRRAVETRFAVLEQAAQVLTHHVPASLSSVVDRPPRRPDADPAPSAHTRGTQ